MSIQGKDKVHNNRKNLKIAQDNENIRLLYFILVQCKDEIL